jgi:broad specificity phosphatase PhoE
MRLLLVFILSWASCTHADEALWKLLREGGQVLLIRHASTTPGVGDPDGFRLENCRTQRNLSEDGRAEARRLGDALRAQNVPVGSVVSSPWCRCMDTVELAFGRMDERWGALGNLFGRSELAQAQVRAMRNRIASFRGKQNLVLVSHGSTVLALTGATAAQAETVVLTPQGDGEFRIAGRIPPPAPR